MPGSQSPSPLRNIDKVLDDSQHTGELILTGRKLKSFPKNSSKYDLIDINRAELSRNQFSDVPDEISQFLWLEHLNLSHNLIRFIPDTLTNLHELVELNISHNHLYEFPPFLCQLRHLQILNLNGNKINSIPEEIGRLWKLTSLDVSCNELTQLPSQLGDLSSLKELNLRRNQLIELPICLSRLKLLRLDISCNRIAHIPCDFRKVTSLEEVNVEGNPLVSPPAHLCLRGLVHVMKFLHKEATKHEHRSIRLNSTGSIQRRLKRSSSFSATSDGRMVGLDRNRSYNIGLSKNFSNDPHLRSDKTEPQRVNSTEGSTTSTSWKPTHDVCSTIDNTSSALIGLNRPRQNVNLVHLATTSSSFNVPGSNINNNSSNKTNAINNNNNRPNTTSDILNNNNIKSTSNDLSITTKSLSTQAQTASQQLEMWINGLHNNSNKNSKPPSSSSSSSTKNDVIKNFESADAITKELMRQKAESEAKKKKIESLKSKMDAAKTEVEKNNILQQYSLDLKTEAGSTNNFASEKVSSVHLSSVIPSQSSSSSSSMPINSWSNSNTLPRCGPAKELFDQHFSKQKVKLPTLKMPTFRKPSEDGEVVKNNKETKQNKNVTAKSNGIASSDFKNGSVPTKQDVLTNGTKSYLTEKDKNQVEKMRKSIESMLKISLPLENLESSLKDGVTLCHLVNHIKPRAVSCIHVPSQSAPILSIPKIRRNVDNFLLACKRIGVDQSNICPSSAIVEDFNPVVLSATINALLSNYSK